MLWFKLEKYIIFTCEDLQTQSLGVLVKYHDLKWQSF